MCSADLSPAKYPVTTTHRYWAQRPFQVVGVQRYIRIIQKYLECICSFQGVVNRLAQGGYPAAGFRFDIVAHTIAKK